MAKKVLLVLPHQNFHDEELDIITEALGKSGLTHEIGSSHLSEARGRYGKLINPDVVLNYVESGDYDAFIFISEEGATEYYSNPDILRLITEAHLAHKPLAALGKAVSILGYTGKLTGLRVTSDPSEQSRIEELGAFFTPQKVVEAENFITGSGPEAAEELANIVVEKLSLETSGYLR